MARARIYIRRSDEDQSSFSPEAQERQDHQWCAENGHEVVAAPYIDDDLSGRKEGRAAFQRLLADAKADPGSIVVVHKFDRVARDAEVILRTYKELKRHGVRLESVSERLDPDTPLGGFMLAVSAGAAQYHSDNLSTEIKKGLREKFEQGGHIGPRPYGYIWQFQQDANGKRIKGSGKLVFSPDADTARLVFTLYDTGNYSDGSLATELNRRGFTLIYRGQRRPFSREGVRKILQNPVYTGKVRYKEIMHDGNHEPLIDQDVFDHCQAIRAQRTAMRLVGEHAGTRTGIGVRPARGDGGLLAELAYCGVCGAKLHWHWSHRHGQRQQGYYRCSSHVMYGDDACTATMLQARRIEPLVLDVMRGLSLIAPLRDAVLAVLQQRLARPITPDGQTITDLEAQLERLRDLYQLGDLTRADYLKRRERVQQLLSQQAPPPTRTLDVERALQLLSDMPALIEAASTAQQRALIGTVIERVWLEHYHVTAIRPAPAYALLIQMYQGENVGDGSSCGPEAPSLTPALPPLWSAFKTPLIPGGVA